MPPGLMCGVRIAEVGGMGATQGFPSSFGGRKLLAGLASLFPSRKDTGYTGRELLGTRVHIYFLFLVVLLGLGKVLQPLLPVRHCVLY